MRPGPLLTVFAIVVGCAGPSPGPVHCTSPACACTTVTRTLETSAVLPVVSTNQDLELAGRHVPATIVRPRLAGCWPAIVLLAGSGPTDRDWGSPTLATHNGSGRLLAAELASHGAVVVRYDKAGTGTNVAPTRLTIDTYRDEALAVIGYLRSRPDVRRDHVYLAGHSEGGVHATRVALAAEPPLAGVIYLASPARPMADILLTQIEANLRTPIAKLAGVDADAELRTLRATFRDFFAGRAVTPETATTIPELQRFVAFELAPPTAVLMRSLLRFDNAREAPRLAIPVLIVNGGKDVQVDPELDARMLAEVFRAAGRDVTLHIAPEADHVLKHETRSLRELRADLWAVNSNYNADGRTLDADAIAAVVAWLARRTR